VENISKTKGTLKQEANKHTITIVYELCVIFMRFGVFSYL